MANACQLGVKAGLDKLALTTTGDAPKGLFFGGIDQ